MTTKIKKIIGIIFILTFVLVGCTNNTENTINTETDTENTDDTNTDSETNTENNSQTEQEKTALEKIQEKGVIVVGNSPDYPPFETIDDNGDIVGFDIDLANEIANKLGVEVEIKEMSFDTIITAVKSGQVDIGMSCFSVSPERLESVDMSVPYLVGGQVLVSTVDFGIEGPEDLNGEKIAVGIGTTGEEAANNIEGAEVTSLDDYNMGFIMLKNGSVKGVVSDLTVANDYVKNDDTYVIVGEPLEYEETAVVISKGNDELTSAINEAIAELKENGKIDEIMEVWGVQ